MESLETAHDHCMENRAEIEVSELCGCFYCLRTYDAKDVIDWVDDGGTAVCPKCGIDSVLADSSQLPVNDSSFLNAMYGHWFV